MIRSGAILFLRIKKEIVSESLLPRRGRDYRTRVEKHDPCIRCAWKENGGVETGRRRCADDKTEAVRNKTHRRNARMRNTNA